MKPTASISEVSGPSLVQNRAGRSRRGPLAWLRGHLATRPFLQNVSIMLSGSAAGQMVSILLAPILTRLYSPQQFGVLSVYTALLMILVVIASLRYELTIPLASDEKDALNLTALSACALVATTAIVAFATYAVPQSVMAALWPTPIDPGTVAWFRGVFVFGFLSLGGYYVALYLATRDGAFGPIARTRLYQGVVGPVSQIALALVGAGSPGLLIGFVLGQSAGTIGLFERLLNHRTVRSVLSVPRMTELARRYSRFPLIASWAALIDAVGGNQLLYLLVSATYSARIAGFIFLAERVVARPLSLVGTSILQVFIGEAGKTAANDPVQLKKRFYQVVSRQFALALGWILVSNLIAALAFPTLFGEQWGDAVIYLQAMSLGYLAQAVVLPVFHTLQILERQALAATWQLTRLGLVAVLFVLPARFGFSAPVTIFCYSVAQAVSCALLLVIMARSIQSLQRRTT